MQEITIPDGHKATIVGGTIRIEPIEKVQEPKFKKGDIVKCTNLIGNSGIYIFSHMSYDERRIAIAGITADEKLKIYDINTTYYYGDFKSQRLATPEEQQILFDALAKEGKYWDAEALEVKDFIKVPENIGIYNGSEDSLLIGFNDNKQFLGYNTKTGQWYVLTNAVILTKVQCHLQPCKREDLRSGDTAFFSPTFRLSEDITSDLGRYVKIVGKANYKTNKSGEIIQERHYSEWWYKLIPINK